MVQTYHHDGTNVPPRWYEYSAAMEFHSPNYTKILNAMRTRTQPSLTLKDMQDETGISIAAIQKLLNQLLDKKY